MTSLDRLLRSKSLRRIALRHSSAPLPPAAHSAPSRAVGGSRASMTAPRPLFPSNDCLEFLGDKVFNSIIALRLAQPAFGSSSASAVESASWLPPGAAPSTAAYQSMNCTASLSQLAARWNLSMQKDLSVSQEFSRPSSASSQRGREKVLARMAEAVIGASFLDNGGRLKPLLQELDGDLTQLSLSPTLSSPAAASNPAQVPSSSSKKSP